MIAIRQIYLSKVFLVTLGIVTFYGCKKEDNPDATDVENLKFPSALKILDNGDKTATLSWTGGNFEDDFHGYNVYGVKMTDAKIEDLKLVKGEPLQLLDAEGDAKED